MAHTEWLPGGTPKKIRESAIVRFGLSVCMAYQWTVASFPGQLCNETMCNSLPKTSNLQECFISNSFETTESGQLLTNGKIMKPHESKCIYNHMPTTCTCLTKL